MRLSELDGLSSFALLGPGFCGGGFVLVSPLERCERAEATILLRSYEDQETSGYAGMVEEIGLLDIDVEPATLRPTFDEALFADGVRKIRDSIAAGDVYQVNLTTRVDLGPVSPDALFASLCRRGLPRFAAWVRTPSLEFVSASPELFFEVCGRDVRVEPMKGTAPAGDRAWLDASLKDEAELAMITDLMRNDLTAVCMPGSVRVLDPRRYIELPYAVQAVSDVVGRLSPKVDPGALIDALHPGGSVTGAPKRAACALIDRLEPSPRGPYCGTLAFRRGPSAVASLLIRTAFRRGDSFVYGVGSGITWDSEVAVELAEIRTKLGAMA